MMYKLTDDPMIAQLVSEIDSFVASGTVPIGWLPEKSRQKQGGRSFVFSIHRDRPGIVLKLYLDSLRYAKKEVMGLTLCRRALGGAVPRVIYSEQQQLPAYTVTEYAPGLLLSDLPRERIPEFMPNLLTVARKIILFPATQYGEIIGDSWAVPNTHDLASYILEMRSYWLSRIQSWERLGSMSGHIATLNSFNSQTFPQ